MLFFLAAIFTILYVSHKYVNSSRLSTFQTAARIFHAISLKQRYIYSYVESRNEMLTGIRSLYLESLNFFLVSANLSFIRMAHRNSSYVSS